MRVTVCVLMASACTVGSFPVASQKRFVSTADGVHLRDAGPTTSISTFSGPTFQQRWRLPAKKGPGNIERPPNEFARTFRTDRVLGNGPRQRDYSISIEATLGERIALAERFELSNIDKLEADVSMRRESHGKGTSNRVAGIEVEGNVRARVTQTCVRTNEDFDVDVEFPLFAIVRPVASIFDTRTQQEEKEDLSELDSYFQKERGSNRKQKSARASERSIDEMDMAELQKILMDFDVEDDVIEDEGIYSMDGIVDVGELVAQLFWLKLDPYPKKPGTGPVQASITG